MSLCFSFCEFSVYHTIMVDRICPKGQIRLRMYRRTFNYTPLEINHATIE